MSQVDNFLNQIKSQTPSNVSVYIPSLNKTVDFLPITVQQQKNIIKDTLSGVNGNIQLQRTLNSIIIVNAIEPTSDLTIIDRSAILIQLRMAYLGDEVTGSGTLKPITPPSPNEEFKVKYPLEQVITENGITVTLNVPTLSKDSSYITFMTTNKEYTNPGDLVNEMYIMEVAKFITKITFNDVTIEPSISDSVRIVNELPTKLITKIMLFIKSVKDIDNDRLITKSGKQVILGTQFFNDPV